MSSTGIGQDSFWTFPAMSHENTKANKQVIVEEVIIEADHAP